MAIPAVRPQLSGSCRDPKEAQILGVSAGTPAPLTQHVKLQDRWNSVLSTRKKEKKALPFDFLSLWPLLRSQGRPCESPRALPRLLALPPPPATECAPAPGGYLSRLARLAVSRTAPRAETKATTDSWGANSWGSPGGPSSFRNPQKLTVFPAAYASAR